MTRSRAEQAEGARPSKGDTPLCSAQRSIPIARPDLQAVPQLVDDPTAGLSLVLGDQVLRADYGKLLPRIAPGALQRELLVRAAKVRGVAHPVAVDATAGLGEDSFLLAAAGFEVTLFERDKTICALLRDAVRRARNAPELAEAAHRMHVAEGDSVAGLRGLGFVPDVVFLDPMFPARSKSAAVKKKLQMIQHLERPCDDEGELLSAALVASPKKVVIKRPVKGAYLAGTKPSYSLAGKAIRYDVLVPPR